MALPTAAVDHYQAQQAVAVDTARQGRRLWRQMGENFDLSWSGIASELQAVAVAGQQAAAVIGLAYVPAVLAEQGIDAPAVAEIDPGRFVGMTGDGRSVEGLLQGAVYHSKRTIGAGLTVQAALAAGGLYLEDALLDSVRDSGNGAVAAGYTVRPEVDGWVRMVNPPSCRDCILLAGKFFRWNQGFQRHKRCDCRHIPSREAVAGDLTIDPYAYFRSLPAGEQERIFGKADAQAIRDGGDIYRVVNIRNRGLASDAMKNRPGRNSGWQARRYGTPSKMTVDDIYAAARNREHAIELMEENGFITGEQVAGGNILGNTPNPFAAGALGRGGTRRGATLAYRRAVETGERDPLEPATQTAAERRLHRAVLMKQAVDRGSNPFGRAPLDDATRALVDRVYRRELERLKNAPAQVVRLARLLGVR